MHYGPCVSTKSTDDCRRNRKEYQLYEVYSTIIAKYGHMNNNGTDAPEGAKADTPYISPIDSSYELRARTVTYAASVRVYSQDRFPVC